MDRPALGFDVYGTLVDPLAMKARLATFAGDRAETMAALWRQKQLEYTFRRGLMGAYCGFARCTAEALEYAAITCGVSLTAPQRRLLLEAYQQLDPFPEVIGALQALASAGHRRVAFSNGEPGPLQELLARGGVMPHLEAIVSVEELETFKPDPKVYHYLAARLETPPDRTWLISSNPFDVIGAKSAGLRAAWVRRSPQSVFDPWGIEPDLVVPDLQALVLALGKGEW